MECRECTNRNKLDFEFTMAFQPIVNLETQTIFAHEALVRGLNNESAQAIFQHINDSNRYLFDQSCRTTAIRLAAELHIPCFLSINFLPNAVYEPERCIRTTLEAAETYGFPIEQIIFEITESEQITDLVHLRKIVEYYRAVVLKQPLMILGQAMLG